MSDDRQRTLIGGTLLAPRLCGVIMTLTNGQIMLLSILPSQPSEFRPPMAWLAFDGLIGVLISCLEIGLIRRVIS
jgi:hypothetical protein